MPVSDADADASAASKRLRALAESRIRETGVPGVSVAVSIGGERFAASAGTVAAGSEIPMSCEARFALGCISKMLTAIVALELCHSGKLKLHDDTRRYVPELRAGAGPSIEIAHLASHTSGYEGISPSEVEHGYFYSWEKFARFFASARQVFAPGTMFNYEHTEGAILGEVIRRVAGEEAGNLARAMILEPLGLEIGSSNRDAREPNVRVADHMLDAGTGRYQIVRSRPYCGFWSASLADMTASVNDLASLGELLVGTRAVPSISTDTVAALRHQVVELPQMSGGPRCERVPHSFGFGCAQYAPGLFGHNGSARGQTCGIRFDPSSKVVVVVALNAWLPHERDSLLDSVLSEFCPLVPQVPEERFAESPPGPEELHGTYTGCLRGLGLQIIRDGERCICTVAGSKGSGKGEIRLIAAVSAAGRLVLESEAGHLSIAALRERQTGVPCVMLGLNAFKKCAEISA